MNKKIAIAQNRINLTALPTENIRRCVWIKF